MEIFAKIPEMLQGILERLAKQTTNGSEVREQAKQKLLKDLKNIMGDMGNLSKFEDTSAIEEQIKQLVEFPQKSAELAALIQKVQSTNSHK